VYSPGLDRRSVLRSCYTASLRVADEVGAASVAFPLISAGAYGWPREDALVQAFSALCAADTQVEQVQLVLFDAATAALAHEVLSQD
jgi:O-acetyl-ADP-ribose deacetylase (regulator of RNase III)